MGKAHHSSFTADRTLNTKSTLDKSRSPEQINNTTRTPNGGITTPFKHDIPTFFSISTALEDSVPGAEMETSSEARQASSHNPSSCPGK